MSDDSTPIEIEEDVCNDLVTAHKLCRLSIYVALKVAYYNVV